MYKCFHFKNLTLFVLLFSMGVFANNTDQWLIQEIKVEDGLPDSTVFLIQQDQSGFMWFGTTNGLARYDGYSFKVFKHDGVAKNLFFIWAIKTLIRLTKLSNICA